MTLPTSTEPVFGILLSELNEWERENLCWSEVQDLQRRIRARGPVVAQQASAAEPFEWQFQTVCIDKPCMHLYEKCPVKSECDTLKQCEENWKFLLENPNVAKENEMIRQQHDAALIAQEREKWERERAGAHRTYESCHKHFACPDGEECWYSSADYYWDCGNGAARVFEAEKKAREDVLDELAQMYANVPEQFLEGTYRLHSEWKEKIESLRHGQKREREPE